jgi:upstream activation factor subunit UAF30
MAKKTTKKAAAPKKATAKKATAKAAPKAAAPKATAKKATAKAAPKATAKKATAKAAPKATAKKATAKAAPKATAKAAAPKKVKIARRPNAAFMKPLNPSKELAEIVGAAALPRTEVMKKVWAYIKKNDLQDQKNRRAINADEKLKAVFGGKKQVTMFEMTKLVSNHLK